jgi:hypothetical protein
MGRLFLLALLAAAPAAAQTGEIGWEDHDRLRAAAASCEDEALDPTGVHVPNPHDENVHLLDGMLEVDPDRCPGVREAAVVALRELLGEPERAEVDLDYLELAWRAAERGQGMAADPALADRYGRMLWLFADDRPRLERWPEAERDAFLVRPETVALLAARNAARDGPHRVGLGRTRRSVTLEAELRLRRELPHYDPARAIDLLEDPHALAGHAARLRLSRMLTDGKLVPPDHLRAARLFLGSALSLVADPPRQAELLRIGRLAAASARTPDERGEALRILFAASLNGHEGSREALAEQLRGVGRSRRAELTADDARRIAEAFGRQLVFGIPLEDDPPEIRPIRLRGLIGPAGHVVYAEVTGSSGGWYRDRVALGGWAYYADRVDLSATARGRFTWVDLPPVDSRPD